MKIKQPVSVFFITLNEADRIGTAIEYAKQIANEIIVIDSGSTDGTQEVCANLGVRVIFHEFKGYGQQKRFGEEQCKNDWILNLDADEVLSESLVEEIINLEFDTDGYVIKIADCLAGEKIPGSFAHTTKAVRLYRKSKGRYADSTVHDRVHFENHANIKELNARVYHHSIRSISHAIEKLNRYSTMQAENLRARGKNIPFFGLRITTEIFTAFFKSYVMRLDILRGRAGFINSVTYAYSRFARLAKIYEANQASSNSGIIPSARR